MVWAALEDRQEQSYLLMTVVRAAARNDNALPDYEPASLKLADLLREADDYEDEGERPEVIRRLTVAQFMAEHGGGE